MGDTYKSVQEVEDDAVVRVGNVINVAGIRWEVTNITTTRDGEKVVSALQLPNGYSRPARVRGNNESARDVAWLSYPPNWPACACGLPTMDGHATCGRAGCGGL
jgi:hypothetical protein